MNVDRKRLASRQEDGSCHPSGLFDPSVGERWTAINWRDAERFVFGLQHRIAVAVERRQWRKVRDLQRLLTKSLAARLLAVRRVAQENSGKRTPGIDGVLWTAPEQKLRAAFALADMKAKPRPLRRVSIPKSNGKTRNLGIPTMRDRAHQALWALALAPVAEELSDRNSYGFRPYRGAWDAYAQIHLLFSRKGRSPDWVLDADIEGFFDHLSHDWLLANIPMDKTVLKSWLKAGILDVDGFIDTDEGTPQGGIISPMLANIALSGLEAYLAERFKPGHSGSGSGRRLHRTQINLVRYADDFVITGRSHRQLERVKEEVSKFLAVRGLRLSEEKTRIVSIEMGFDFLGWTFRRMRDSTFLGQISAKSIKAHRAKMKELIKSSGNKPVDVLIRELNQTMTGWMNYHRCASNIWTVWSANGEWLYRRMWHWASKRHRAHTSGWVRSRYWRNLKGWTTFCGPERTLRHYDARHMPIVRMPGDLNAYRRENQETIDRIHQRKKSAVLMGDRRKLWQRQGGKCSGCGYRIEDPAKADIHHRIPTAVGGADTLDNKELLHEHCHYHYTNHSQLRDGKLRETAA